MSQLVWISGASRGIGRALAESVPWPTARVIGISRTDKELPALAEHLALDLADPRAWDALGESFRRELANFGGDRVVFAHCAGTIEPVGFAGEVDGDAYRDNVVLNSASPQVLGHLFLAAAAGLTSARRQLVMITSGAAKSVYPGWTSYGAAKAGVDQWVRNAGAEQEIRGGVEVVAIAPGTVDTDMQARIRATDAADFSQRQKFIDLFDGKKLTPANEVAAKMWRLLDSDLDDGSVVDLRNLT